LDPNLEPCKRQTDAAVSKTAELVQPLEYRSLFGFCRLSWHCISGASRLKHADLSCKLKSTRKREKFRKPLSQRKSRPMTAVTCGPLLPEKPAHREFEYMLSAVTVTRINPMLTIWRPTRLSFNTTTPNNDAVTGS